MAGVLLEGGPAAYIVSVRVKEGALNPSAKMTHKQFRGPKPK